MQARMKKYPLTQEQSAALLLRESVGRLGTIGEGGYPYIVPVHYVYLDGCIYVHGLMAGMKVDNIRRDPRVSFEVDSLLSLVHADLPCDTNTGYESVIIRGKAAFVEDTEKKTAVLDAIVMKYTPRHAGKAFPETVLRKTAVIGISVDLLTGKYYPTA